jgi:hypothetical protein
MSLPPSPPPLPKWPFLLGDAAFLGAAWLVADRAAQPLGAPALLALVALVAGAGLLGAVPFLLDYARKQDEALDDRQRSLEALAATAAAAAEQISIAAAGYQELAEIAQKNLKHAEALPHKLQEKIAEFNASVANAAEEDREELEQELAALRASESERLESTADKVVRAAAEWGKAEAAAQKHLSAAKGVLAEFDRRLAALQAAVPAPANPGPVSPPAAAPPPSEPPPPTPAEPTASAPVAAAEAVAAPAEAAEKPAPRKRAPKKVVKEEEAALPLDGLDAPAPEFSPGAPEETAPVVALTADGATRLIVTAYIGIGNRLFIRGEGPGLSWDEGVPLQFVSIGKWRWETTEATAPVQFKLYKNDQIECAALASRTLEPGHQQELTAAF